MFKKLGALLLICMLFGTQVSCTWLKSNLPTVITDVQDGITILNSLSGLASMFFLANPNPKLQAQVNADITDAQTALDAGLRATQGITDLTQAQYTQAFGPFVTAYTELKNLLISTGVIKGTGSVLAVTATPGGYVIPEPMIVVKASNK